MAFYSIEKRTTSTGERRYRCTVAVRSNGKYVFRENKTFKRMALATAWGVQRVAEIDTLGIPHPTLASVTLTLGDLIDKYMDHPHIQFARSKSDALKLIRRCQISELPVSDLTQKSYIDHCEYRAATGAGPATRWQDMSFIGSVLKAAKPMFDIDISIENYNNARYTMTKARMITPGGIRSRRPTREECSSLIEALKSRKETSYLDIPYSDIFMFSIFTCMRIGEVTRLRWDDVDEEQRAVIVRDRKDPRKKIGNHMKVALLGEAWKIVQQQPRRSDLIFPFKSRTISQAFRQERDRLGIADLRYHDLRREGVSRLFEAGFTIEDVAQVSGHRSMKLLWKVYTELFPQSLHDKYDAYLAKINQAIDFE